MYALCVGQDWVSPGEFWTLAPGELWWLIDAKMPKDGPGPSLGDMEELYQSLRAEQAKEGA